MFEVVVRPVVFPNIRPNRPRVLPAASTSSPGDADAGIAVIGGSSGRLIDLQHSLTTSFSTSHPQIETVRKVTKEKVQQVDQKGNINKQNFVEVERVTALRMEGDERGAQKLLFAEPPAAKNVETIQADMVRRAT
jgi:hypothetical protein